MNDDVKRTPKTEATKDDDNEKTTKKPQMNKCSMLQI